MNDMTIKEIRQLTGLTQAEFAKKYHISEKSIQNWEQGMRTCPPYVRHLLFRVVTECDCINKNHKIKNGDRK